MCGIQDEIRAASHEHRAALAPQPLDDVRQIDEVASLAGVGRKDERRDVLAERAHAFLVEALEGPLVAPRVGRHRLEDLAIVDAPAERGAELDRELAASRSELARERDPGSFGLRRPGGRAFRRAPAHFREATLAVRKFHAGKRRSHDGLPLPTSPRPDSEPSDNVVPRRRACMPAPRASRNEHRVAVAEEAIALRDGLPVGGEDALTSRERRRRA